MIIVHIIGNLLFILFLLMNIIKIKDKKINIGKVAWGSFILGCITYIAYLIMIFSNLDLLALDKQSFTILILAWAFENSTYVIAKDKNQ